MSISDYSSTPSSNTAINGINIDEGCSPGNLNNAIRQIMADIAADLKTGEDIQEYSQKLTNIANNLTATVTQLNLLAEMEALSGSGSTLVTTGIQGDDGQLAVWSSFGNITGKDVTSSVNATQAIPTSAAVKSYVDGTYVHQDDGWADLPSGLKFRWGAKIASQDDPQTFTFRKSWSNTFVVNVTPRDSQGQSDIGTPLAVTAVSPTGFTATRDNSVDGNFPFFYFAVGV